MNKTTSELWDMVHTNLVCGRWSLAVRWMETLSGRTDNADLLADARAYGCPEHLVQYLQDRIDACNAKV